MKNLDINGDIVQADPMDYYSPKRLREIVFEALNKNEYEFTWTQDKKQPYSGIFCDGSKVIDLYIYVWNVTPTYINDSEEQKRIQINARVDNAGFQRDNSATKKTLLLGVYRCPKQPVIVAWDSEHYKNHSQNTCYVDIDELQKGLADGIFTCKHNCTVQVMTEENFPVYVSHMTKGNKLSFSMSGLTPAQKFQAARDKKKDRYIANVDRIKAKLASLTETERKAYIKQRVGQGEFKKILLDKYACKCALCGITTQPLLVASHIKPWSKSSNAEKLNPHNGLLLCAHHDALFDKGLLSFAADGTPVFSSLLTEDEKTQLRLDEIPNLEVPEEMKPFLLWHRTNLLK